MRLRAKFISYAARTLLWAFTGPGPFVFLGRKYEIKPTPRAPSNPHQTARPNSQTASDGITLRGEQP
jgi:hypothetical protein